MSLDTRLRDAERELHRSVEHLEPPTTADLTGYRRRRRMAAVFAFGLALAAVVVGTALLVSWATVEPDVADEPATSAPTTTTTVPTTAPPSTVAETTVATEGTSPVTVPPPPDPSALVWTRVPHDEAVFGDDVHGTWLRDLAAGHGGWLAVGYTGPAWNGWPDFRGTVWASKDGAAWVRLADHEDDFQVSPYVDTVTFELRAVTATETGWVVVGYAEEGDPPRPGIWTSADGSSWTRMTGAVAFTDVAAWGSRVVAVGNTGGPYVDLAAAVWTSGDGGATWQPVRDEQAVFGGVGESDWVMNAVAAGPLGFVAVGADRSGDHWDAAVWTSVDGVAWTRVPGAEAVFGGPGTQTMTDVVATGDGYLAVGIESLTLDESEPPLLTDADRDAAVWLSDDGITWTRVPHDEANFGGEGHQVMRSVAAGPSGFLAVGTSAVGERTEAAVWASSDGVSWTRLTEVPAFDNPQGAGMRAVAANGDGFLVGGWEEVTGDLGRAWIAAVWMAAPPAGGG